jgi:rfaE bifunctional protein kinase chain/domain
MLRLDYDHRQAPIAPEGFEPEEWIIFSDYGKGSLDRVRELIKKAPASKIFVDPRGSDYERYRGAWYIKPNLDEMKDLVGSWKTEQQLEERAHNVVRELDLEGLLLTMGAAGMTLYTPAYKYHSPAHHQEIFDVCGAGDTSLAAFAVALARGLSPEEAVFYASKAAGITCQHLGSYSPSEKEVFGGSD